MTREEFESFVFENYSALCDRPWARHPDHQVFRHPENGKWFALAADIPKSALNGGSDELVGVVNLKIDPVVSGSFLTEAGIHPAYHMNKDKWITLELAVVPDETIKLLLEMSFDATKEKKRASR